MKSSIQSFSIAVLLGVQQSSAWICAGILEEDYCNMLGGCTRSFYLVAKQDDNVQKNGGSGEGAYSVSELCGQTWENIGTLECTGDVEAACVDNVATIGGFTCRTRCDGDGTCVQYSLPSLGQSASMPAALVCD